MDPAAQHFMQPWLAREACPSLECRQFEFNPHPGETADYICFGTVQGNTGILNWRSRQVVGAVRDFGTKADDPVLGLCWLRSNPYRYLAGSSDGAIRLVEAEPIMTGSASWRADAQPAWRARPTPAPTADGHVPDLQVVHSFPRFGELTCVHVNCTDAYALTSGYNRDVRVMDMNNGKVVRVFQDAHEAHINITRLVTLHASCRFGCGCAASLVCVSHDR